MDFLPRILCIGITVLIATSSRTCWCKIADQSDTKRPGSMVQSVVRLTQLLDAERQLVVDLQAYVHEEIQRIEVVKNALHIARAAANTRTTDETAPILKSQVNHPVAALKLVEQFVYGWNSLINKGANHTNYEELMRSTEKNRKLGETVSEEDLVQSAKSVVRLQEIYKLDSKELASGKIAGKQSGELGADDCRNIALLCMERGSFGDGLEWIAAAFQKTEEGETLQSNLWTLGQMARAGKEFYESEATEQDLDLSYASNDLLHENLAWETPPYELPDDMRGFWDESRDTMWILGPVVTMEISDTHPDIQRYTTLCRGGQVSTKLPEGARRRLYCRYSTARPCRYCLYKEEIVHRQPLVKRVHDFLTDVQAKILIDRGEKELEPAETSQFKYDEAGHLSKRSGVSVHRIGMVGWLYNTSNMPQIGRLNAHVRELTRLDAEDWAEPWQIGVYGLGGHYGPHKDADTGMLFQSVCDEKLNDLPLHLFQTLHKDANTAFHKLYVKGKLSGDRIATFMIYLNDVELGGSTVFTDLSISVKPIKNSAIMWYNLSHDGEHDNNVKHGSCPVILGHKWIANKWIHERGQEFNRPCGRKQSHYYGDTLQF